MSSTNSCLRCGGKHEKTAECPAWNNTCFGCGFRGHFKSLCKSKRHFIPVKGVHEVQETNTGKSTKNKNVDVVDVIQSLSLHEQKSKNNVNMQELTVKHSNPVFHGPVHTQVGNMNWEKYQIMELTKYYVATPVKNWDN